MKTKFSFVDPGAIMGIVVALIVLAVGTYAAFYTLNQITSSGGITYANNPQAVMAVNNTTTTATNVFNIVGVVLIIGAIMSIVGLVYNYVR